MSTDPFHRDARAGPQVDKKRSLRPNGHNKRKVPIMHGLLLILLQIMVIIIGARVMGWCFRKIHQPQVMGEMVAGILLGPSFLGWLAPGAMETLFPAASLNQLNMFSQIGLVIFMFLVGLELDPQLLRGRSHAAVVISHVSIIAPFFLGTTLALYLYPKLSDASVGEFGIEIERQCC